MKVMHIAKHQVNRNKNDNIGAIDLAFEQLGHDVDKVEINSEFTGRGNYDLILFHQDLKDLDKLKELKGAKVFWNFDRIRDDDPSMRSMCNRRARWMASVTPICDMGFFDRDWETPWHPLVP